MTKVIDIVNKFEEFAPKRIAEDGDPIGLQLGSLHNDVHKMMVALDVRPETVDEAIENNVDFIFAHHPAMFVPVKKFDLDVPQNAMYAKLIKHDITVYGAHTNLDNANGGMNDWLAEQLGLENTEFLLPTKVDPVSNEKYFMGRVGELKDSLTAVEFAEYCKKVLNLRGLRLIAADNQKPVKRVAVLGGSGGRFFNAALLHKADAYVTGDISYHTGHDMIAAGLTVVDAGHHIESICKPKLTDKFKKWNNENDWKIDIYQSKLNTDPFQFI